MNLGKDHSDNVNFNANFGGDFNPGLEGMNKIIPK